MPEISFGNMPNDGGNYLFKSEEKVEFLESEPDAEQFFKEFVSAKEFLNNEKRYCLWLSYAEPSVLKKMPKLLQRIENVRELRLASSREATRKMADMPTEFGEVRQPSSDYILIPRHSSENREYVPLGYLSADKIVADSCLAIGNATLYHFGILTSKMHMTWVRYTCGRLKSDYRYSKDIVYNNFPWPGCGERSDGERSELSDGVTGVSETVKTRIEAAAQAVLDARAAFSGSSLADLYDPRTIPPALRKVHDSLDRAVDHAYGLSSHTSDPDRIAFLFGLYEKITKG